MAAGSPEAVVGTVAVFAVQLILVTIVAAVVVAVAQPVWLHADVGRLALAMTSRTRGGCVLTPLQRLVRGLVVATVVDTVTHLVCIDRQSSGRRSKFEGKDRDQCTEVDHAVSKRNIPLDSDFGG